MKSREAITKWKLQEKLFYANGMKYGEGTASICQEVTGIDELIESEMKFYIFGAKYPSPFFFEDVLKEFFQTLQC